MMAHYLLNDLIRETFPWTQPTAMEHYRRLLTRYGILRLLLSGVAAGQNVAPNESKMAETIQVFCRIYQHNNDFAKQAESLLAESDWPNSNAGTARCTRTSVETAAVQQTFRPGAPATALPSSEFAHRYSICAA